jgi:Uma2 family endonuclease
MTTILHKPKDLPAPSKKIPPLRNGDRLTRTEFERRYKAMPNLKKAELVEGIVYMPSPVSFLDHAEPHATVIIWLGFYKMITPGIRIGDNGTLRLDLDNEPQPDAFAIIPPERGGQAKIGADGYVEGAPELVFEVASSSVSIDLHKKLEVYRRNGVKEYVVWKIEEHEIVWFVLRDGMYVPMTPDEQGLYHSEALPGLVMDPVAMLLGDLQKLSKDQALQGDTEAHQRFLQTLTGETQA